MGTPVRRSQFYPDFWLEWSKQKLQIVDKFLKNKVFLEKARLFNFIT